MSSILSVLNEKWTIKHSSAGRHTTYVNVGSPPTNGYIVEFNGLDGKDKERARQATLGHQCLQALVGFDGELKVNIDLNRLAEIAKKLVEGG